MKIPGDFHLRSVWSLGLGEKRGQGAEDATREAVANVSPAWTV